MNRIKDYIGFAGWFAGLGYIALWPVTAEGLSGKPFGASVLCRDASFRVLDLLCNSAHPLKLPAGLHALGFLSAVFVAVRLLHYAITRRRRAAAGPTTLAVPIRPLQNAAPPPRRRKPQPLHPVKPRNHFGLRGVPR